MCLKYQELVEANIGAIKAQMRLREWSPASIIAAACPQKERGIPLNTVYTVFSNGDGKNSFACYLLVHFKDELVQKICSTHEVAREEVKKCERELVLRRQ